MNKKTLLIALALVVLFASAWTFQPKPQQWEYKFVYNAPEKKANELGAQGWELVGAAAENSSTGSATLYLFKRAKP